MKAIVYQRFGSPDILECREVEKRVPGCDEVLIKVRAASINLGLYTAGAALPSRPA